MITKEKVKIAIKQSQIILYRDLNVYQIDTYRSGSGCKNTPNTDQDSFYHAEGTKERNIMKIDAIGLEMIVYNDDKDSQNEDRDESLSCH